MFLPTAGINEIKEFIFSVVKNAGPDACPPYVVGVGIGGTADYACFLAKKALLRKLNAKRYTLYAIQHHHAHTASCMAENGLKNQKVIGVAFDGTGLGADGTLWGAEFLLCDYKNFIRAAHLKEIPLLGGEKAILEPWRLAAAWLYLLYGRKFLNLKINFVRNLDKDKWRILEKMRKINLNCPPASSMGRLFDAAGALILGKKNAAYEAELAVGLEKLASGFKVTSPCQQAGESQVTSYSFKIIKSSNGYIIDPAPIFKQIVSDFKDKQPKEKMAYKFHLATAEMVRKTCLLLRKDTGIKKVALSGGVWQNKLLLKTTLDLLYKEGFMVLTQKNISCSDSGISLGQAVIANYRN
jgi:hydrogenase maturation protein HypF